MPFAGKCAHQEGQRYPVFWKCFSPSSLCEVASCRAFFEWFAEFPLWQACLLCKKIMRIHLRIRWSQNPDQLVHAKKRIRIRRGASWRSTTHLNNITFVVQLYTFFAPSIKVGASAVPVFCSRAHGVCLYAFKGKSSLANYEEVCPRPWTCRGKDAKSRGTDILGRGKGIKRNARDYVCWKRFGTMAALGFSKKPFDRKLPLTNNYS